MVKAQYYKSICVLTVNHKLYFTGLVTCHAQGYAQDTSTRPPKSVYMPGTKRSAGTKIAPFWPSWTASLKFFHSLHTIIFWRTWTVETVNLISQIWHQQNTLHCPNSKSEISKKTWHQIITPIYASCISPRIIMYHSLANKSHLFHFAKEGKKWFVEISLNGNEKFPYQLEWIACFPVNHVDLKTRYL